jgi:hypothetical protein
VTGITATWSGRLSAAVRAGTCHMCGAQADAECVICRLPLCDGCARVKGGERFCSPVCPKDG